MEGDTTNVSQAMQLAVVAKKNMLYIFFIMLVALNLMNLPMMPNVLHFIPADPNSYKPYTTNVVLVFRLFR
jgi:hypothetical protein